MSESNHTFLLHQAIWDAEGKYFNPAGDEIKLAGVIKISHTVAQWHCDELLKIPAKGVDFFHSAEMMPIKNGSCCTSWEGFNKQFGLITGRYVIVSDVMISSFKSGTGLFNGVEYARFIDKFTYELKGYLFEKECLKYSWVLQLNRKL